MRRLVTQFDERRTRATVATPTCCCCCCCCVATVVTTTAVSALTAYDLAKRDESTAPLRWLYGLAGMLALPAAVLLATAVSYVPGFAEPAGAATLAVLAFVVCWPAALAFLYRRLGMARTGVVVGLTVILGTVAFVAELAVAAQLLLRQEGGGLAYLVLVVLAVCLAVPLLRRWIVAAGA